MCNGLPVTLVGSAAFLMARTQVVAGLSSAWMALILVGPVVVAVRGRSVFSGSSSSPEHLAASIVRSGPAGFRVTSCVGSWAERAADPGLRDELDVLAVQTLREL
jgi:hypothetical protein